VPWRWSFHLAGAGVVDAQGVMHQDGWIAVRLADGTALEYHERGSAPPDLGKGQAKQAKHAVSDCFKRCAVHLGVGRYLYELEGVRAGQVPKASLEKALAAVGYRGPWDDRHHGAIGGMREADEEDEVQGRAAPPVAPPAENPSTRTAPAPSRADREPAVSAEETMPAEGEAERAALLRRLKTLAAEIWPGDLGPSQYRTWVKKELGEHPAGEPVAERDLRELVAVLEHHRPRQPDLARTKLRGSYRDGRRRVEALGYTVQALQGRETEAALKRGGESLRRAVPARSTARGSDGERPGSSPGSSEGEPEGAEAVR
jgi:hypothetical protein